MIQHLPTEIRHEILSYIVPPGRNENVVLYLQDWPYTLKSPKFRYGKHNSSNTDFVYIFSVSRQLLQDAVEIYYGTRTFCLEYGLRHQNDQRHYGTNGEVGDALRADSLSLIPKYALQAVRRLHILIRHDLSDATTYRRTRAKIQAFAAKLEDGHSLMSLEVHVTNVQRFWMKAWLQSCYQYRFEAPLPEKDALRCGFVLEPLRAIYGVQMVTIKGLNPAFDLKLERVLRSCTKTTLKEVVTVAGSDTKQSSRARVAKQAPTRRRKAHMPVYDWSII